MILLVSVIEFAILSVLAIGTYNNDLLISAFEAYLDIRIANSSKLSHTCLTNYRSIPYLYYFVILISRARISSYGTFRWVLCTFMEAKLQDHIEILVSYIVLLTTRFLSHIEWIKNSNIYKLKPLTRFFNFSVPSFFRIFFLVSFASSCTPCSFSSLYLACDYRLIIVVELSSSDTERRSSWDVLRLKNTKRVFTCPWNLRERIIHAFRVVKFTMIELERVNFHPCYTRRPK